MPWHPNDAPRHDKKAKSGVAKRQWSDVANSVLKRTGNEGEAVREANGVIGKRTRGEVHEYDHRRPRRPVLSRYSK